MKGGKGIISIMIASGVLMSGCRPATSTTQDADSLSSSRQTPLPESTKDAKAYQWADSVMAGMTLEQMAGQLILPAVFSDHSEIALRKVVAYASDSHIGGVVLLRGTPEAAGSIADTLKALSSSPPFIAIDAEWGLAMRLSDTPHYPRNGRISPSAEDSLLYEYGREVARECREVGINMVLGPVLDVVDARSGGKSFIGNRSFGSDPRRVARLGVAYSRGLEDGGVMSVAKHFPGHGSADGDSHRRLPVVSKSLVELQECDLLPFREYVGNNLSGIMTGHLYVPALDSIRRPVSVSGKILGGLLREEMGFGGLIMTDAMNMTGAEGSSGVDAIMAGADIVLAPADTHRETAMISDAVRSGRFPLQEFRQRVRRVLMMKFRFCTGREYSDTDQSVRIRERLTRK